MDAPSQTLLRNLPAPYNQAVDQTLDPSLNQGLDQALDPSLQLLRESSSSGLQRPVADRPLGPGFGLAGLLAAWHLTSLDAPTVAVCWCLALAAVTGVRLPIWVPIALGLGTWSIYLGDRLMDAKRALAPLRERHWFHWQHRLFLLPIAVASLVVALVLVLREMPAAIRARDAVLALAAAVYFLAIHSRSVAPSESARGRDQRLRTLRHILSRVASKETFVGLIFALVCAAPAATRAPHGFSRLIAPVVGCFLLAWLNCWLIEHWDSGVSVGHRPQLALASAAAVAALPCFVADVIPAALFLLAIAASALLLAWLDHARPRLDALHLRAAADFVLLTPVLVLLLRGAR